MNFESKFLLHLNLNLELQRLQLNLYLNKNLIETSKALNLSLEEVKVLIQNSFKSSFLDEKSKNNWVNKI